MAAITNVEDLRLLAYRKLPRALYDYIDCGAYDEVTKHANEADFQSIRLRQRVMADVSKRSLEASIVGAPSAMPVMISPVGLAGLLAGGGDGEIFAARAAKAANVPFGLSMMSIAAMEEIRDATSRDFWFHIMPLKDRGVIRSLMARATAAGCSTLIVTVDWQVPSQRHKNIKNGLSLPPRLNLRHVWQFAVKPAWVLRTVTNRRSRQCGNLEDAVSKSESLPQWLAGQLDDSATWEYVRWIRDNWAGKLIVKGVLDPRDAVEALNSGADAISVSNHGGTQLDGAPSAISMLPVIADAVAGRAEILFDSGVRSGQDVIKALALGARACLLGRPYLYGLGAMGEAGVTKMLAIIRRELDVTLALTGLRSVRDVGSEILHR